MRKTDEQKRESSSPTRPLDLPAPNLDPVSTRGTNVSANSGCHQCC